MAVMGGRNGHRDDTDVSAAKWLQRVRSVNRRRGSATAATLPTRLPTWPQRPAGKPPARRRPLPNYLAQETLSQMCHRVAKPPPTQQQPQKGEATRR